MNTKRRIVRWTSSRIPFAAGLSACALLFTALLWSGVAAGIGIQLRYDSILFPLGLGALFYALARLPRPLASPALMLLTVGMCGAVLSGVWDAAVSDLSLQAGLFQQRDSYTKLEGSVGLLINGVLPEAASRRPLSPAIGATLLAACQGNVRGMLALTVFLAALALTLPVREMIRTHGWTAGYALHLALFFFYRRFIGTCLSEHAGLALGCLAFALLWRSARSGRTAPTLAGVFVLTLSLNARAGAFFVLPALAWWAGWARRGASRFSATACALVCIAAGGGFALNSAVLHSLGTPGASMGNFSYTLYGLVHGGDWKKVVQDRPELRLLPEIERNKAIYDLALRRVAEQPSSLAAGTMRAYRSFFFSADGPFAFLRFALQRSNLRLPAPEGGTSDPILHRIAADPWKYLQITATLGWFLGLSALALLGVVTMIRARGPESRLTLFASAGILASVPFVPPWDADLMRAYASTMPFMMAFPAVGAAALLTLARRGRTAERLDPLPPTDSGTGMLLLAVVAVPALCLAPLLLRQRPSPAPPAAEAGADGALWTIRLLPGAQVRLEAGDGFAAWSSRVDPAVARRNIGVMVQNYPNRAAEFAAVVTAGGTLAMGWDRRASGLRHLLLDSSQAGLLGSGWTEVRAEPARGDGETWWWRIRPAADALTNPEPARRIDPP